MERKTIKTNSPKDLLRKLLVSEYFILILGVIYFFAVSVFRPKMITPTNIAI